jgi:hypothetical protein
MKVFEDEGRSHRPIRAGRNLVEVNDQTPRGQLRELDAGQVPRVGSGSDGCHVAGDPAASIWRRCIRASCSSVMAVPNFAHMKRYDAFLTAAQRTDSFVAELRTLQSIPEYRERPP